MSQFLGANPDDLDRLAGCFLQWASAIDDHRFSLGRQLHAVPWHGQSADRFRADWNARYSPSLANWIASMRAAAHVLQVQAQQQRDASAASATVSPALVGPGSSRSVVFSAATPADPKDLAAVDKLAAAAEKSSGRYFPGAVAKMQAWDQQLHSGHPSAADVEAFRRFVILIDLAHLQRGVVSDAAGLAVSSFQDASQSEAAAIASAFGAIPGANEFSFAHAAEGVGIGSAISMIQDHVVGALTSGNPAPIVSAYDSTADQYLASLSSPTVNGLHAVNTQQVFSNSADSMNQQMAAVRYQDIASDSTHMITGDGSVVQTVATSVLGEIPAVGNVYNGLSAVANQAHASAAMQTSINSLNIASVSSMSSLQSAAAAMQLAS